MIGDGGRPEEYVEKYGGESDHRVSRQLFKEVLRTAMLVWKP